MKNKFFPIFFTLLVIYGTSLFAEIKYIIEGEELIFNYRNTEYKTSVMGNAVMDQFQKGSNAFFEVHVNPSLSELVVFNLKTKKITTYHYTQYFINGSSDILTIVDPPHFSSEESDVKREISVNGSSVCRFDKSMDLDVKISSGRFNIYSAGKLIGSISKNKKIWVFKKLN
ncbi:MAG: hypothetical protein CVV49_11195 [Spirochaetae bacterium HGW-Spirochaetae-5]|nr:MAG: hypothetical protein CVV49_11195 [Spirochaetae bacterium HGW-Spirochaetae-5]